VTVPLGVASSISLANSISTTELVGLLKVSNAIMIVYKIGRHHISRMMYGNCDLDCLGHFDII